MRARTAQGRTQARTIPGLSGGWTKGLDKMREIILKAAIEIIESNGLGGLKARDLAAASDCAVGTIYNYFGNLDGVILAINIETLELLEARLREKLPATPSPTISDRLVALAEGYLSFATDETARWRALFEHRLSEGRDVPEPMRVQQSRLFKLIEDAIADQMTDPCELSCAARALFAAVHGNISLALDSKLGPFDADETRRQIAFVVQCVARGLSKVPAA